MKTQLKISFIILSLIFILPGCYTVIWNPQNRLPEQGDNQSTTTYYPQPYYGPYAPYYDVPWWYSIPTTAYTPVVIERDKTQTDLRNGGEGRNPQPRNPSVPAPTIPTRSSDNTSTTSTGSKDKNSTPASSSSSADRSSQSSGNNSTRNNNGSRNTDRSHR